MSTDIPEKKTRILIKRKISGRSFRIFDIRVCDKSSKLLSESSDNESLDSENQSEVQYSRKDDIFVIQCFGINDLGKSVSISITDFTPFFYIQVGNTWNHANSIILLSEIRNKLNYMRDSIKSIELVDKVKLYGFSGGKPSRFALIKFSTATAMKRTSNLWYTYDKISGMRRKVPFRSQGVSLQLYESFIPPLLRYLHIHNISPSGWVFVNINTSQIPSTPTSNCDFEYICKLSSVTPLPNKETMVPYKVMSFDIEASSSHGDFPIASKSHWRLAMQLVDLYTKQSNINVFKDSTKLRPFIENIIQSGFGFSKCIGIDIVYPKIPVSRERVVSMTRRFIECPVTNMRVPVNTNTMSIELALERARNMNDNDNDNDNEDGDDNDADNDDTVMRPEQDDEAESSIKRTLVNLTHSMPLSATIETVLCSELYNRREKIDVINEVMAGIFPSLKGDEVTMIGSTFVRFGEKEPYLNNCIVVNSCDPVKGVEIESVIDEKSLLLKWADLVQKEKPDIIIGYNIFGFDYKFMFERSTENECEQEFLLLSRNIGELCAVENRYTGKLELSNTKCKVATGEYDLFYPSISGTMQIDMLTYMRKEHTLSSYKLDDVAGIFIGDNIKRVEITNDNTYLYTSNIAGLHVGDYIHIQIKGFTNDYYANGKKFIVSEIMSNVETDDGKYTIIGFNHAEPDLIHIDSLKWCMAKDDVSVADIFRLTAGSSADRARVAKYCVQDCNLVHHIFNKIDVLTGYIEMARICSVPMSFLVFRGQGIKLTSFVAKKCREKNTVMPDLDKSFKNDGYEGAIVLPPKCAIYHNNPVACVDYSSLYPSSMISQNYSHDSKVSTIEYDLEGNVISESGDKNPLTGEYIYDNLPGYSYVNIQYDTFAYISKTITSKAIKTKIGYKLCRWAQLPNGQRSIMPAILDELLTARTTTRALGKSEKDPFMRNVLDKRQLGYKLTANSLYGQCGSKTSTFYEKDVAASTCATGRMMIMYAKKIIEDVYKCREYNTLCHGPVITNAEYVYGDTDSVFFTFNLTDKDTGDKIVGKKALEITIEIAQDAASVCSEFLKPPMNLCYEKTLMPFILLSKKRYVGTLYETDSNKGKLKYMGLSLKRRDSCDYLKDIYGGILDILMKNSEISQAINFLNISLTNLISGDVPMDKLTITKQLRGDYKKPEQIAHWVLADRIGERDAGNKPAPGDRMKFVHIVIPPGRGGKKVLQGHKIETPEFIIQNNVSIDYSFYITNQIMKPLQQLFGLALETILINKPSAIRKYHDEINRIKENSDNIDIYMKKKEKYCSAKIKILLFNKYLEKIHNNQNNIRVITDWYSACSTK
jgi:DNA polymerase elongation subunit (family B)